MENPKEEQKQHLIDIMRGDEELGLYEEPKQETLEDTFTSLENELIKEATKVWKESHPNPIEMALFGAKWQQERSYSEEEVVRIIASLLHTPKLVEESSWEDIAKWFEQNKKK